MMCSATSGKTSRATLAIPRKRLGRAWVDRRIAHLTPNYCLCAWVESGSLGGGEDMDRIWLKSYPAGVPADIDPGKYRSLIELFDSSIAKYRDRPAFHSMGKSITFDQLDKRSRDFGAWLQSRGLAKGARVAIMMPNCLQYPIAMFGVLRAGCTVVNVNPLYTPRELEHQLKDSGAEVIVILENFGHVLQEVRARTPLKHVVVTSLGEMLGVKGLVVNLVVRKVKKMVPAYELPGAVSFKEVLGAGKEKT